MVTHTLTTGHAGEVAHQVTRARNPYANLDRFKRIHRHPTARGIALDALAVVVAVLDVWLVIPSKAQPYSIVLSGIACAALVLRRRFPFLAVLVTIPGFLAGWAQIAAMIALFTLARRKLWMWQTMAAGALVFASRYVLWPLPDFADLSWRQHILRGIYGVLMAGMPIALGLLMALRKQLSDRLADLAESREREQRLHEQTIRSAERASLAREMHDVVSHQVTLIAMQAGALAVSAHDEESRQGANTIRQLSKRTLDELRDLVGVLRSGAVDDGVHPGLEELPQLLRNSEVPVELAEQKVPDFVPPAVSRAAYRTVQESLTNIHKHSPGAKAMIRVFPCGSALIVEVVNDEADPEMAHSGRLPSGGHGLLGVRERAALLGGTFHAGHTPDGGFRVCVTYPMDTS
ncbi:sensor histidine kinase [Kibdelosporangium phytohabitans]|uniref:sensor histidine kinase n=1 Tax=Kibdelosporangium phytohabitans TaxID=860235 RepID=UPI0019E26E36|nr:histidine kinase [Kibdelosporangium phytohabitans]MBE1463009.1 signal transduction histidine kinase [Kibdelosporangium phytohabitans]